MTFGIIRSEATEFFRSTDGVSYIAGAIAGQLARGACGAAGAADDKPDVAARGGVGDSAFALSSRGPDGGGRTCHARCEAAAREAG